MTAVLRHIVAAKKHFSFQRTVRVSVIALLTGEAAIVRRKGSTRSSILELLDGH